MMDKHFLQLLIPMKLRQELSILDETSIKNYNAQWEFHTTPVYRMKYENLEIKLGGISQLSDILLYNCPEYAKNEFKNALNLYGKGFWVASISLCGIIVEYLTKFYFPRDQENNKDFKKLGNSQRIKFLYKEVVVSRKMKKYLLAINRIRNESVHLDTIEYSDLIPKNIECINKLIAVLYEVSAIQFENR